MAKKYDLYWELLSKHIGEISEEFKNLYIKMISYSPKLRPSIDDILKDPWMKEVTSLDNKGYNELEDEVNKEFKKREIDVVANKEETIQADSSSSNEFSYENDRGVSDDEVEYFDLSLTPKYIQKKGLIMNNYIKINGNLRPCHFMNSLANKIVKNFEDNVKIEESKKSLKFNVIFKEILEDQEEPDEELEKELDKLSLEKNEEIKVVIAHKDCVIQVKLFQSLNGGYLVRFVKKEGEIEDYYKNLDSIKSIIKKIL
jgi:serine/threonine protein kinase